MNCHINPTRCGRSPGRQGFTLIEILNTIVIIGITTGVVAVFQRSTWGSTRSTNNTLVAGQLIQRQIEQVRMEIAMDTSKLRLVYPAGTTGNLTDPESRIALRWSVAAATDPTAAAITLVRQFTYTAKWQSTKAESLVVVTCVARDF
jgi:prepilin-type N-terminal cleavage/methylation domain-containing protein